jgi:hypothetical protein
MHAAAHQPGALPYGGSQWATPGMHGAQAYSHQPQMYLGYAPMPPQYGAMGAYPGGTYLGGAMPIGAGMQQPPAGAPGATGGQAGRGQAGIASLMEELNNGGSGLNSLGKMLNFEDTEFWKGALVGAAAVILLTNDSVQNALFQTGAKTKDAVQAGVDKIKTAAAGAGDKE